MNVNESGDFSEPDEDEASNEVLLHDPYSTISVLPGAPFHLKAVQLCSLLGQLRYLKWWLTKIFLDHLNIFYMYAEMGNNELTEMQLKFQDSPNPSVFIITPTVGGEGLNDTVVDHVVITQKCWVLNEQCQEFA